MSQPPRFQDHGGGKLLFFSEILIVCAAFYGAAMIDLDVDPTLYFLYEGGAERLAFAAASILIALYFYHLYSNLRVTSRVFFLQQLCGVFGIALIAQSVLGYVNPDWILPRWLMIYGAAISMLTIFAWRLFYSRFVLNIVRRQRIMFVGNNETVRHVAGEMSRSPERGYEILGFVGESAAGQQPGALLGNLDLLGNLVRKTRPDRIVVGLEDRRSNMPTATLLDLRYAGMTIEEASETYETVYRRVCARDINPAELIFSNALTPAANNLWIQRWIDRIGGLLLGILSLPVIALLAIVLRLQSSEPVLVRMPRIGKHGRHFQLLRFRKAAILGSLYQRLHLDAMPELWNVLRGEMSLVGPRPQAPDIAAEKALELPLYDYRHNVQPGMTGWAQINLSGPDQDLDPLTTLEYDLYYIKHMSQSLNAYILLTTFKNRLVWADQV
jgi:lipopolysaccharide/colanic/teichoic acid biosynthesis glycosyltransferase